MTRAVCALVAPLCHGLVEGLGADGEKMEFDMTSQGKIAGLMRRGVSIPNPLTLDVGDEVPLSQISGKDVKIYPGCRIYGENTVIAQGAQIGSEGPVTLENCQVGPMVELKGGYFRDSVFLARSSMGLGAHVREACILEEEASGAHCVGLKQTILFPFVTLGSLINFCDCLMAGGRSRKDHSEVGSSYIHFNYTPDGDKSTPSMLGDVPRGVMLNQPPIFLGGQGGMVGPLRLGFGNVVAAGTILRKDVPQDLKMVAGETHRPGIRAFVPHGYVHLDRMLRNNILFLANLVALDHWYRYVRQPFFAAMELGSLLYEGAVSKLALARKERTQRLMAMVEKVPANHEKCRCSEKGGKALCQLHGHIHSLCELFTAPFEDARERELGASFSLAMEEHRGQKGDDYIQVIQGLPWEISQLGVRWLQHIVQSLCRKAGSLLSSFELFDERDLSSP